MKSEAGDAKPDRPTEIPLPDGIGLTLEEAKNMLALNGHSFGEDDPIFMLVTLNNGFICQYQKVFTQHEKALEQFMVRETEKHQKALAGLSDQLSHITLEGIQKAGRAIEDKMTSTKRDMLWLSLICAVSALSIVVTILLK